MNKFVGYRCSLCGQEFSPNEVTYTCPKDGGNLDVVLDYDSIKHKYKPEDLLSRSDSHLALLGELPAAHARFVQAMLAIDFPGAALEYADKALADEPGDAMLRAVREQAAAAVAATPR